MNARQKAKYYKRKYEELARKPKPVQFHVEQHRIDTIRYTRLYDPWLAEKESYIKDILAKDLCFKLSEQLKDYVEINSCFEPHLNKIRFDAKVWVVRKEGY